MVTSVTGKASSPFSIQKPPAPRLKSPVTALKPKPIMLVTRGRAWWSAAMSSGVCVPARRWKLLPEMPTPPELPREALAGARALELLPA